MSSDNGRFRVDANRLKLREHAAALEAAEPYKDSPASADYVVAGMVWQFKLRDDPTFTYEQALDMEFGDLDIVGEAGVDADPEVLSANSGAPVPSSAEPGESVPVP